MKLHLSKLIIFTLLFLPTFLLAEEEIYQNLGFIRNNIWYSKYPFLDGEFIKIYSALFNTSPSDFEGTVEFYDNNSPIGKAEFSVPGNGKVQEVWTSWKAIVGEHTITAKIIRATIVQENRARQEIKLENNVAGQSKIFVDTDTDGDKLPNAKDEDDDNDGRSDAVEREQGTDPLKKDEPPLSEEIKQGKLTELAAKGAKKIAKGAETLREKSLEAVEERRDSVSQDIKSADNEDRAKIKKPLTYLYLALLYGAGFALRYKILFYLILLIFGYFLFRFFRNK